jgi:hypothetical protein
MPPVPRKPDPPSEKVERSPATRATPPAVGAQGRVPGGVANRPGTCLVDGAAFVRPVFTNPEITGIDKTRIETCADLAFIYHFDCAFEAVDVLVTRFQDGTPIECGVADDLNAYIVDRPNQLPANERRAVTARVFKGYPGSGEDLYALFDELHEALLDFYCSCTTGTRVGPNPNLAVTPVMAEAAVEFVVEKLQRLLSRNGAGIGHYVVERAAAQLNACFKILDSEDLCRFFGCEYDDGLHGRIDRLLSERGKQGASRRPAFQQAKLAAESQKMIEALADLVPTDETDLTPAQIDRLAAQLALLRSVSGQRNVRRSEKLDDEAAQEGANIIKMVRAARDSFG